MDMVRKLLVPLPLETYGGTTCSWTKQALELLHDGQREHLSYGERTRTYSVRVAAASPQIKESASRA